MPPRKRHRNRTPVLVPTTPEPSSTTIWAVDNPTSVTSLVQDLFDPTRYRPLVVVSAANDTRQPRIDVDLLAAEISEHANIAVLGSGATTWAFTNNVPEHFRAYGGGIRIFWPYAAPDDDPDRHPLFVTRLTDDPDRTIARIRRCLADKGFLPDLAPVDHPAPWTETQPASQQPTPREDTIDRLLGELSTAQQRIATLTSENTDLRKSVRSLTDQVQALEQRLHQTDVYTDPNKQLRHEIHHAWLLTYSETDRERHPLAEYTFGPDFIHSVDTIEGVDRDKDVSTCVDVLTRRAWEVNGRQARQFRAGTAPTAPYLVRDTDAATAWRCNVQTATASARRLMWWEVPDGSIELAVVALHDDLDFR